MAEPKLPILPTIDESNQEYWVGCAKGELRLQRCSQCGRYRFPPAAICPACLSSDFRWLASTGRGSLWSWIVMHQQYFSKYLLSPPYVVALVQLDEGPFMISSVDDTGSLTCDQRVEVYFDQVADELWLPRFRISEISEN